jgi:ribA/ribD-fused uncharacterized protein
MSNPIQWHQKCSSPPNLNSNPASFGPSSPLVVRDTLQRQAVAQTAAQNSTIFSQVWDCIIHFFKSLFSFVSTSTQPFTPTNTDTKTKIQEIAARDHFVWFYKKEENPLTAFMGNFHPCSIELWGLRFQCAEAAFQAAKFSPNKAVMQRFQNLDGQSAFRLGRQLSQSWTRSQTDAWRTQNLDVMREVAHAKFHQNPELKALLLATGNAYLVEHIPVRGRDAYWGDNGDGTGKNWLGRVLMETRQGLGGVSCVPANAQYNQFLAQGRR